MKDGQITGSTDSWIEKRRANRSEEARRTNIEKEKKQRDGNRANERKEKGMGRKR